MEELKNVKAAGFEELKTRVVGKSFGKGKDRFMVIGANKRFHIRYANPAQTRIHDDFIDFEDMLKIIDAYDKEMKLKISQAPNKYNADGTIKRAMSSVQASRAKKGGHNNEDKFAAAVDGTVIGRHTKSDVFVVNPFNDKKRRISVKASVSETARDKLQIFLNTYGYFVSHRHPWSRIMIDCIECFPENREDYTNDKIKYKKALMPHMRDLRDFLSNVSNLKMFLDKSFFDNDTDDLVILDNQEAWHLFPKKIVIEELPSFIKIENSKAGTGRDDQHDDQKVLLKSNKVGWCKEWVNVGEIEMRNDSPDHYREVKFRMDKNKLLELLQRACSMTRKKIKPFGQTIFLYADAIDEWSFIGGELPTGDDDEVIKV